MALEHVQTRPLDDVPDPHGRVVTARDAVLSVSGDGSDGAGVALEMMHVERVLARRNVHVVVSASFVGLQKGSFEEEKEESTQSISLVVHVYSLAEERRGRKERDRGTQLKGWNQTYEIRLALLREPPDSDRAVPRAGDDERIRRKELSVRLSYGVDDLEASLPKGQSDSGSQIIRSLVSALRLLPVSMLLERKRGGRGSRKEGRDCSRLYWYGHGRRASGPADRATRSGRTDPLSPRRGRRLYTATPRRRLRVRRACSGGRRL
jgi:hypothetical protein